jgi:hypothetical protein
MPCLGRFLPSLRPLPFGVAGVFFVSGQTARPWQPFAHQVAAVRVARTPGPAGGIAPGGQISGAGGGPLDL